MERHETMTPSSWMRAVASNAVPSSSSMGARTPSGSRTVAPRWGARLRRVEHEDPQHAAVLRPLHLRDETITL